MTRSIRQSLSERLLRVVKLHGHTFIPVLTARSTVLDLGANVGGFSRAIRSRFGCPTRMVEANPALADALRADFGDHVLHAAAVSVPGDVTFQIDDNPEASRVVAGAGPASSGSALSGPSRPGCVTVRGMTLAQILEHFALPHVDLLKVDIEGAELGLLRHTPPEILARCDQVTVEFHNLAGVGSEQDVRDVVSHLRSLGFVGGRFDGISARSRHSIWKDHLNWLFVNTRAPSVSTSERMLALGPSRMVRWGMQLARRGVASAKGEIPGAGAA
ncbi:MAG: FkbM family methyltransferase [Planctomycetota bacterium]|nr:FkbM family methyltransferase [Planctomycetota bacterium]